MKSKKSKTGHSLKLHRLKKIWRAHPRTRWTLLTVFSLFLLSFIICEALVLSQFDRDDSNSSHNPYVLILGSGLKEGDQLPVTLRQRVDTGLVYWQQHRDSKIIVSGGQGVDETVPEAVAMRDYLLKQGVPPGAILLESRSTSTYENLLFSQKVIDADRDTASGTYNAIIVTSNYHMYRARYIAEHLGYTAYDGISSPSPLRLIPVSVLREYLAMIKTVLTV
ncbi:YdcF family protein [Paenibacillus shenyangensis]|uniref:YdcF family protein n=1 Tax=Paenibacillus sp. A9 TaxID=1284352 RepID=UPI0009DA9896|nr:YdcF family protein [Paenibacillus sp. A9]